MSSDHPRSLGELIGEVLREYAETTRAELQRSADEALCSGGGPQATADLPDGVSAARAARARAAVGEAFASFTATSGESLLASGGMPVLRRDGGRRRRC
jgi:uncharacterized MAPEG superfamily protein